MSKTAKEVILKEDLDIPFSRVWEKFKVFWSHGTLWNQLESKLPQKRHQVRPKGTKSYITVLKALRERKKQICLKKK